jgi:hypothetical protein
MSLEIDSRIEKYLSNSLHGLNLLYGAKLYGQMLVLLYSCIDAMGLLDAPPSQIKATGDSFKNWVKKYMLGDPRINFNELDFGRRAVQCFTPSRPNLIYPTTIMQKNYSITLAPKNRHKPSYLHPQRL